MILTFLRYPTRLNKLSSAPQPAHAKLYDGEQCLIRTVDEKLTFTTHRLIQQRAPWPLQNERHVLLEDIQSCEVKATGKPLYLVLGILSTFLVYFNDSFMLLGGFFVMLFLMTRHQRIHIKTTDTTMVLPLEVEEERFISLLHMVRQANQARHTKSEFLRQTA